MLNIVKGLITIGIIGAGFVLAVTLSIVYDPIWITAYFVLLIAWAIGKLFG